MGIHREEDGVIGVIRSIQLLDANAKLSALVTSAENGVSTTIVRRGRPVARVVPVEAIRRSHPKERSSFADLLLAYPGGIEFERDSPPS
jgi:prevent-host-death family protein